MDKAYYNLTLSVPTVQAWVAHVIGAYTWNEVLLTAGREKGREKKLSANLSTSLAASLRQCYSEASTSLWRIPSPWAMIARFQLNFQFENFKDKFLSIPLSKGERWQSSLPCMSALTCSQDSRAMLHPLRSASELGTFSEAGMWGRCIEAEFDQCQRKRKKVISKPFYKLCCLPAR